MKVAFFVSDNSQMSGAFKCLVTMVKLLRDDYGVIPKVIVPRHGDGEQLLDQEKIDYVCIHSHDWITPINLYNLPKERAKWIAEKATNLKAIFKIKKVLKEFDPDLVHINTSWDYVGATAACDLRIPIVWHIREFLEEDQFCRFWDKKKAYNLISKSAGIIAISQAIKEKYQPIFGDKIETIYDGLDDSIYYSNHELFNDTTQILTVGGLYPGKGQAKVLKALGSLNKKGITDFKYKLVGKGGEQATLEKIAQKEGISDRVKFYGFSENPEQFYQKSDIFVMASASEAFGRVTVEAMMNGLLVIGKNSAATAEILKNGECGLLFEDEHDLANKLEKVMANKEQACFLAKKGQDNAMQNYTANHNADKIYALYHSILKKRKK